MRRKAERQEEKEERKKKQRVRIWREEKGKKL